MGSVLTGEGEKLPQEMAKDLAKDKHFNLYGYDSNQSDSDDEPISDLE